MDIYLCDAGNRKHIGSSDEPDYYYGQRVMNLVVAKTRGHARSIFTKRFWFEFIDNGISISKIMGDVDIQTAFVAGEYDYGYREREKPLQQYEDKCWAIVCQKEADTQENVSYEDCPYYGICQSSCKYIKGLAK